jgi:eukaryotic-like serine/threonine-protein kinase
MAPELFRGAFTIGPWIDIYSFGATFFELLTGQLPVDAGAGNWAEAHRHTGKPDPARHRPDLHSGFAYIVEHCLDADPMRRYRSFAELEHDLQMLRRHLFKQQLEQHTATSREALADQLRSQGVAHLSLNEPRAALHSFKRATELRPDQADLWLDYALTAITLWQDEDALEACKRGLSLQPEANLAAQLELARGRAFARKHYTEEALQAYDRSLKLNRFDAQTHLARGELLATLGVHDEALRCYEAAARYDRLNPRAWQLLSAAQLAADQTRAALESIDNALRIDPRNGASWRQRGECLQRLRRIRAAGEAFAMALKIDPDDDAAQAGMRGLQQAQRR